MGWLFITEETVRPPALTRPGIGTGRPASIPPAFRVCSSAPSPSIVYQALSSNGIGTLRKTTM